MYIYIFKSRIDFQKTLSYNKKRKCCYSTKFFKKGVKKSMKLKKLLTLSLITVICVGGNNDQCG